MKFKKLSAFALGALFALISFAVSADGENVYLHYTFDSAVAEDVTLADGEVVPMWKFDGAEETFIHYSKTNMWESGWYEYDTDRNDVYKGVPTLREVYAENGKLNVKFAPYNRMSVRVPSEAVGSVVKLTFDLGVPSGANLNVLIDNDNSQKVYPTYTTEDGIRKYTFTFKVKSGDFLCIESKSGSNVSLILDNYIVEKEPDFAIESSYPEDGAQDATADKPIEFAFTHDIKSVNGITVNGEDITDADYKIDGKVLSILNVGGKKIENGFNYDIKITSVTDAYGRTVRNIEKSFGTVEEFTIDSAVFEKNGSERKFNIGKIVNNTPSDRELTLKIIVIKDGELLKSEKSLVAIPSGSEASAVVTLSLDGLTQSGYTVKALLWDEGYGIMPIIKHAE